MRVPARVRLLLVPLAILVVMSVVASLGLRGIFPSWDFVPAAVIGALGAATIAVSGRWLRLTIPEVLLLSLCAFVFFGAIAVGGVPTLDNFELFFDGLLNGWAEVLSSTPPADITAEFRVLPFTIAWFGVMVGSEIVRSTRTPGLGAIGPVGALVVVMLITLEDRAVAIAQGIVMVVGSLLLGFVQQRRRSLDAEMFDDMTIEGPSRRAGLIPAAVMLAVIAVAAPIAGPRLPLAEANDRFDLRQFQTPPFDPLRQPSPLVQLKAALQEANADTVVFTVSSDRQLDRFPLAVLDHYNSEFWAVADENGDPGGQFRPVDSQFPVPVGATIEGWERVTATIELVGLSEVARGDFDPDWLPLTGWPVALDTTEGLDLRFNRESGTLAVAPEGGDEGLVYDLVAALPPPLENVELSEATVTVGEDLNLAVPQIISFAGDALEGADVGWEQVEAIRTALVAGAYDSRANSPTARAGHSLGRLTEFLADPERVAGFEEQYAATAALIARGEGLPARVVVGFQIPPDELADRWAGGTLSVVAEDISAWIEVRFDEIGWLPFDVTPPRDREPEETSSGRSQREVAVPNPPPEPPPPVLPPELDRDAELEEEEEQQDDDEVDEVGSSDGLPLAAVAIAVGAASPLLLLFGGALVIIVTKRRRTKRRRSQGPPSRRVAGAWHEVIDRYAELGAVPRKTATPQEFARGLRGSEFVDSDEGDVLLQLADDVSTAAFHPVPADTDAAEHAWERTDELLTSLSNKQRGLDRLKSRLNPKPLLHKDPLMLDEEDHD